MLHVKGIVCHFGKCVFYQTNARVVFIFTHLSLGKKCRSIFPQMWNYSFAQQEKDHVVTLIYLSCTEENK